MNLLYVCTIYVVRTYTEEELKHKKRRVFDLIFPVEVLRSALQRSTLHITYTTTS